MEDKDFGRFGANQSFSKLLAVFKPNFAYFHQPVTLQNQINSKSLFGNSLESLEVLTHKLYRDKGIVAKDATKG